MTFQDCIPPSSLQKITDKGMLNVSIIVFPIHWWFEGFEGFLGYNLLVMQSSDKALKKISSLILTLLYPKLRYLKYLKYHHLFWYCCILKMEIFPVQAATVLLRPHHLCPNIHDGNQYHYSMICSMILFLEFIYVPTFMTIINIISSWPYKAKIYASKDPAYSLLKWHTHCFVRLFPIFWVKFLRCVSLGCHSGWTTSPHLPELLLQSPHSLPCKNFPS